MMRSMYSGVAGLKTHQTKMDVIGNNIANVNTTAYKSSSINFSELMYQTTSKASGPNATTGRAGVNPKQIGLGVQSAAISTKITSAEPHRQPVIRLILESTARHSLLSVVTVIQIILQETVLSMWMQQVILLCHPMVTM